jgi:tetratricopeptide (TPR) repeat protein
MLNREKDLIKEAEEWENQSKKAESDKNYELAITVLMQAKDNYTKVGLTGQVAIIIKEIVRLKRLKGDKKPSIRSSGGIQNKMESKTQFKSSLQKLGETKPENTQMSEANGNVFLENARNLALEDKYDESLKAYNEAYSTFKLLEYEYECKQILWQINEIKDYQRMAGFRKSKGIPINLKDIVALASAERRRQRIQQGLGAKPRPVEIEEYKNTLKNKSYTPRPKGSKLLGQMKLTEKRNEELKNTSLSTLKEQQMNFESKRNEKLKKLQALKEEKKQNDELIAKGQGLLEKGNEKLKQKEYDQAKIFYTQAIELFTQLGWHNQISILEKELRNIDMYKKEEEKKGEMARLTKLKQEQEFQSRVSKVMSEKERYNKKLQQQKTALTPDIRSKIEKIKLVQVKAEKEESSNNFSRALARYQYIIELYQSIPKETIDLSNEISKIEQKILDLKPKS